MSDLIQVTDRVWCIRQKSYFACSYIVKASGGLVLIDAGMSSDGEPMLQAIDSIGFEPGAVRAILLTHWHNDHAAGASAISQLSGAKVFYHEMDAPNFSRAAARTSILGTIGDLVPELGPLVLFKGLLGNALPKPVAADAFVKDNQVIFDDFEVIETPGHTAGHVCYYFRPGKILFAGDALAVIGDHLRFMARPVTPDIGSARASMRKCLDREIDVVCPGHRQPLKKRVSDERKRFLTMLEETTRWPLLG